MHRPRLDFVLPLVSIVSAIAAAGCAHTGGEAHAPPDDPPSEGSIAAHDPRMIDVRDDRTDPAPGPEPAAASSEPEAATADEASAQSAPAERASRPVFALEGSGVGGGGASLGRARRSPSRLGGGRHGARHAPSQARPLDREGYDHVDPGRTVAVSDEPLSTFAVDVDTASYANVRRFLKQGTLPPPSAVRVEEMINYFRYDYPAPAPDEAFSISTSLAACPWAPEHRLLQVGIRAEDIPSDRLPPRNLVFLVDVSGSMHGADKLPLLKESFSLLVDSLRDEDKVALVVYAGSSGLVLPPTPGSDRGAILAALERLEAGGSTNGGAGIELAYRIATENFVRGGINRVVLASDGDFNVGVSSRGELERLIEEKRRSGVFLSVLGFGRGNLRDSTMEMLARKGNGNYAYIDSLREAKKVLVREAGATLHTVAKDVKIQVEWNPANVKSYRLIGYENRRLAARDFNDDTKDAGEIGAGHTVTALYEVVPRGAESGAAPSVDPLRYGSRGAPGATHEDELATVKVRHKAPSSDASRLLTRTVPTRATEASADLRFAAAVAGFGLYLRRDPEAGALSLTKLGRLAESGIGDDRYGDRRELLALIDAARTLGEHRTTANAAR